ncbi:MAG: MATE family efflux transporter [Candidatus Margulisiibacteriota bacterium]
MLHKIKHGFSRLRQKRDLTSGSVAKNIWILAIPLVLGDFLQTCSNLIDMFWVGKLGPDALAAVAMSGSILMVVATFLMGIATGTTALVARYVGAKNDREAARFAAQSIVMGLAASFVLAIFGFLFSHQLLIFMGAKDTVLIYGTDYLRIIFLGSLTMFFFFIFFAILRGAGDAVTPAVVLMFCVVIGATLEPFLVFGIGPFPRLGVAGAALAEICAQMVGVIIGTEILLRGRSHLHLHLHDFKINFAYMWRIIRIGFPTSLQMGLRSLMGVVMMLIVASFGTGAIAGYGVVLRLSMILMLPGFSLANSAATLVGQNLGAGEPERAEKSAWLTASYYAVFMAVVGILGFVFGPQVIHFFNSDPQVVAVGTAFIRITIFSYLFVPYGIVLGRSMAGAGDAVSPLIITFIGLWLVQIPLALILARSIGLNGVWLSFLIANSINGVITMGWFKVGRWKHKIV